MSTIIDEHKTEKEEWEKLREGNLISAILQSAGAGAQASNERDRAGGIQEAVFARMRDFAEQREQDHLPDH